jgi:hypothetical protein
VRIRDFLHREVQRQWRRGGWLSTLLTPLSALAGLAVRHKRQAYLDGRRTGWRAPVPVVVVGNIYVGGTGKTPVVVAILQGLRARGYTPGMVSRGYGVRIEGPPRVAVGVGALTSATKSAMVKSVSWPTPLITGMAHAATARARSSSLKLQRSSMLPPPRTRSSVSTSWRALAARTWAARRSAASAPWTGAG